jgi:hypothetical protein
MEIDKQSKNYIDFTFEDFLQDDFFIKSVLRPTEESELFWQEYKKKNRDYAQAVRCIKDLNKDLLDKEVVHNVWRHIQTSNHHRRTKFRWFYFIPGSVVAASIALLFYINPYFAEKNNNQQDIRSFANNNIPIVEATETQLFVSDSKIISLPEKESVILYDSASIKVTSQEILQQEISKNDIANFNQLIIPKGKRSFLTLADGTQIWINSGTRLVYPSAFPDDKREIFVDGEIYIDVQPDYSRPFIVQAGDMDIRVLGTQFNVQAYQTDGQKRVVLKSGSVKISSGTSKEEIVLQPNEMYEATGANVIVKPVNINNYVSWIDGIYICESERLDYILSRLSKYYGKEITVDKKAAGLKCNGKLDLKESLNDVLNILKYIAPIEYTSGNNIYSVTYKPQMPMEKVN